MNKHYNKRPGGGRDSFRSDRRGGFSKEMFEAVCSECGDKCEVPFRPTGDKPVYCSNCFGGKRDNNSRGGDRFGKKSFGDRGPRRDFGDRPARPQFDGGRGNDEIKRGLEQVNIKLDQLIRSIDLLAKANVSQPVETKVAEARKVKAEPAKKTVVAKKEVKKVVAKKTAKTKKK